MYPVSEAYKSWIYNNNSPEGRIFDISGYIDAPFGRVDIDPADLVAGSVKLEDATISNDSLEIGSVFSAGLSFSVYNNKSEYSDISFNGCEASFSVGYKLESGVFEWVPLGQFIIIESSVPANTISFRALDKMILLSSVKWADINVVFPATVREIANACFSAAALPPLPADSFLHDDYVVDAAFTDDNFTARDIVSYCAQIAGCYAKIDRNGTPKFGWYGDIRTPVYYSLNANVDEITGLGIEDGALKVLSGGYEEQDESFYSIGLDDRIDFRVSGSTIYVTGILYEHGEESHLYGRREYLIVLEDNPLVQENMNAVMSAIYEKIGRFAYIPYESKIFGDPAREAGDLVTILHKDGTEYHTIITNISYTFRGESSIEARGKSRELNSVQGSTVKKISSIVQNLKKNEDQLSLFGQSMLNNSNLIANMLGGYAIQTESDFYIADNPDINLASKVWKWGIGGFGYSESGIGGPYVTSVSASGSIVAYLIDAGIVKADNVTTGVLQSQNGHSKLNLNDGTFSFGNGSLSWSGSNLNILGNISTLYGNNTRVDVTGGKVQFWTNTSKLVGEISNYDFSHKQGLNINAGVESTFLALGGFVSGGFHPKYYINFGENPAEQTQRHIFYDDMKINGNFYTRHIYAGGVIEGFRIQPQADNDESCGIPSRRWTTVYAVNGTIQTSGLKDKENIKPVISKDIANIKTITAKNSIATANIATATDEAYSEEAVAKDGVSIDEVYEEDFIDLLDLIADKECTYNYKVNKDKEDKTIPQSSIQLGVIADEISDHKAYKYIGVKEELEDGTINHGLQPLPIAMLAIVGYGRLRDQNNAQEQKINDLEARIARLEKLIGGTK